MNNMLIYLMLGMRLANDVTKEILTSPSERKRREERSKKNSAEDSIRMALTLFESLGESFKQQAAYAHFQLGCYHRNCCLKLLELGQKKRDSSKGVLEQYVSLAKRSWQSALEFYGPQAHPHMYLTILMERSDLLLRLSGPAMQESSLSYLHEALSYILEGQHVSDKASENFIIQNFYVPLRLVYIKTRTLVTMV